MFKVPNISSIDEYEDNLKLIKKNVTIINKYASHHFEYSTLRKRI
jgi:hypothetical protein